MSFDFWDSPPEIKEINTIIIGAGPAGIAASIQLKRAGINFILIEKDNIGGLLLNANLVENYPGFPQGITGPDLVGRFLEQLNHLDIDIEMDEVTLADQTDTGFSVKAIEAEYACKNLIIASGTNARSLGANSSRLRSNNIIYEIYDIRNITDKKIAIIGSGDAAFDYALNLAKYNKVTILMRTEAPKCLNLLYERAKKNENIAIYKGDERDLTGHPERAKREKDLSRDSSSATSGLRMTDNYDHIIAAIGREPNTCFLGERIKNHFLEKTKAPGLYFIGDLKNGRNRQVAIAASDGIKAAMDVIRRSFGCASG